MYTFRNNVADSFKYRHLRKSQERKNLPLYTGDIFASSVILAIPQIIYLFIFVPWLNSRPCTCNVGPFAPELNPRLIPQILQFIFWYDIWRWGETHKRSLLNLLESGGSAQGFLSACFKDFAANTAMSEKVMCRDL